jgi:hypothetical protein
VPAAGDYEYELRHDGAVIATGRIQLDEPPSPGDELALGSKRTQPTTDASLAKGELPFRMFELPLADRDGSRTLAQRPLQVFEVGIASSIVLIALQSPLRHRASNVHALCDNAHQEYDQASCGRAGCA